MAKRIRSAESSLKYLTTRVNLASNQFTSVATLRRNVRVNEDIQTAQVGKVADLEKAQIIRDNKITTLEEEYATLKRVTNNVLGSCFKELSREKAEHEKARSARRIGESVVLCALALLAVGVGRVLQMEQARQN